MHLDLLAWTVLGLIGVVVSHELTHVLIAHAHGHRTVCVAVNPIGVAVVFEDTPCPRYWAWQVALPMLVTAVCSYGWLYGLVTFPADLHGTRASEAILSGLPALVALLALLTSGGDILGLLFERSQPLQGDERIRRDLKILRKMPTFVHFTAYGRQRWQADWLALAVPSMPVLVTVPEPTVVRGPGR
jgi:hypothetical protein